MQSLFATSGWPTWPKRKLSETPGPRNAMKPSRLPTTPTDASEQPNPARLAPTPVGVPPRHRPLAHEARTRTMSPTPSLASGKTATTMALINMTRPRPPWNRTIS